MLLGSIVAIATLAGPGIRGQEQPAELVEVQLAQAIGGELQPFVVELEAMEGEGHVALRVTEGEAQAILRHAEGEQSQRPMSHQLLCNLLETTGLTLLGAIIGPQDDLHRRTCALWIQDGEEEFVAEARPGDAVAAALCAEAPILLVKEPLATPEPPPREEAVQYAYVLCERRDDPAVPRTEPLVMLGAVGTPNRGAQGPLRKRFGPGCPVCCGHAAWRCSALTRLGCASTIR